MGGLFGQDPNILRWLAFFSFRKRIFSSTKTGEPTGLLFWIPVSLVPDRGGATLRPVVDHQFANWWIAPELREGHELDRKIDGHCESTRVDANANLHGGWFIARGRKREPSWRGIHCRANVSIYLCTYAPLVNCRAPNSGRAFTSTYAFGASGAPFAAFRRVLPVRRLGKTTTGQSVTAPETGTRETGIQNQRTVGSPVLVEEKIRSLKEKNVSRRTNIRILTQQASQDSNPGLGCKENSFIKKENNARRRADLSARSAAPPHIVPPFHVVFFPKNTECKVFPLACAPASPFVRKITGFLAFPLDKTGKS